MIEYDRIIADNWIPLVNPLVNPLVEQIPRGSTTNWLKILQSSASALFAQSHLAQKKELVRKLREPIDH